MKIGALLSSHAVWPFVGAQFSTFWDGNSLHDDGTKAKLVFGYISLSQKDVVAQTEKKSLS